MIWLLLLLSLTASNQDAKQEIRQIKSAVENMKMLSYKVNDNRLFDVLNDYLRTEVEIYPDEVEIHRIYQDNIDNDSAYQIYKKKLEKKS